MLRISGLIVALTWLVAVPCSGQTVSGMDMEVLSITPNDSSSETYDIWGWTDPQKGVEYAVVGANDAVRFYDLIDPVNPALRGVWPVDGFDVKVANGFAYSNDGSFLDMSVVRNGSSSTTFVSSGEFSSNSWHNVFINEDTNRMYASTGATGIGFFDITNPYNTVSLGGVTGGGHDAMSVIYHGPDARYAGKEILFGSQNSKFGIYDVTNPEETTLGSVGGFALAHQGWPSEDHSLFFMTDEGRSNQVFVFDIADLQQPQLLGDLRPSTIGDTFGLPHNIYVDGELLHLSNYSGGTRIFRLDDPAGLKVTELSSAKISGGSAFSVYPYFESGLIITSDLHQGLVVQRQLPRGTSLDFNDDGGLDCQDILLLANAIENEQYVPEYDLSGARQRLGERDIERWLEVAAEVQFGIGAEFLPGDANLDGAVDVMDFYVWNTHKFTNQLSLCQGDFNSDGFVDVSDFNIWNTNKFTSLESQTVPEPGGWWVMGLVFTIAFQSRVESRSGKRPSRRSKL